MHQTVASQADRCLEIRRRARGLSRSSEVVVEIFIRFNGSREVVVPKWYALGCRERVGHADSVLDLQSMISREPCFFGHVVDGLTCRPLNSFLLRSSNCFEESLSPCPVVETLFACWMKAVQISAFAFLLS